jgi:hypothetical protein
MDIPFKKIKTHIHVPDQFRLEQRNIQRTFSIIFMYAIYVAISLLVTLLQNYLTVFS